MLTDKQATETALILILSRLNKLASYDHSEEIGEMLCMAYCETDECAHDSVESAQEIRDVHAAVKDAVGSLRSSIDAYAYAHGVQVHAAS